MTAGPDILNDFMEQLKAFSPNTNLSSTSMDVGVEVQDTMPTTETPDPSLHLLAEVSKSVKRTVEEDISSQPVGKKKCFSSESSSSVNVKVKNLPQVFHDVSQISKILHKLIIFETFLFVLDRFCQVVRCTAVEWRLCHQA